LQLLKRIVTSFDITEFPRIKLQMLNWSSRFNICCFLDDHNYGLPPHSYECLLAAGARHTLQAGAGTAFEQLKAFSLQHHDWLFGHFAYDLKNETEALTSSHKDGVKFPDLFFFVPEIVIRLEASKLVISTFDADPNQIFSDICSSSAGSMHNQRPSAQVQSRFNKEEYLEVVNALRRHILRGDCYEINFCQEFFAEDAVIDPVSVYTSLGEISPNPFTAFYKTGHQYLLCASPERYLKKTGDVIISQPVKGTWQRDHTNLLRDDERKQELLHSAKDRSENVMIVDLVRNDLSKICEESSVRVDELFGIYTFPQVHQMISTISGRLQRELHWTDAIRATFPMGSMTGAPKKRVMEIIEQYERTRRGIFSGAVGYVSPEGDFDFNVVIRSILYNQASRYLSYQVGSGITFYSDAEAEYEECMLKAEAIRKVLSRMG
jgi:para-aminobenzoate synthetase component I